MVIYTHLGEITLDGEAVSFHETLSGAFSRAGFRIDANGRRLLGVVEMLGLFKLIRSAANLNTSAGGGGTGPGQGQLSSQLPIAPPASYYAEVTETDLCYDEQGASTNSCESNGRPVPLRGRARGAWQRSAACGDPTSSLRGERVLVEQSAAASTTICSGQWTQRGEGLTLAPLQAGGLGD